MVKILLIMSAKESSAFIEESTVFIDAICDRKIGLLELVAHLISDFESGSEMKKNALWTLSNICAEKEFTYKNEVVERC